MRFGVISDTELLLLDGTRAGVVLGHNPLAEPPAMAAQKLDGLRGPVIGWSGGLGDGLFGRSMRTWMPEGRAALGATLDAAVPVLRESGATLLLRPHARHVISDFVAAKGLLKERPDDPIGIALDPAACFEASMIPDAEDHLRRMFLGAGALASVIVLGSVTVPEGGLEAAEAPDAPPIPRCPLGEGLLDAALLGELVKEYAGPGAIVCAAGDDPAAQLARAGLSGA